MYKIYKILHGKMCIITIEYIKRQFKRLLKHIFDIADKLFYNLNNYFAVHIACENVH